MKRLLFAAAVLALLALPALAAAPTSAEGPTGSGTCSARPTDKPTQQRQAEIAAEEARVIENSKKFDPQHKELRDSHAGEIDRNEDIADQYVKDHPPAGKQTAQVVGFESTMLGPDNETDVFDHHHEIHYLLRGMPVRVAKFDRDGRLIEDKITPIGNALQSADAFSDGVDGTLCEISFTHDANGQTIISEIYIHGTSDRGQILRGHLWFNEEGLAYRGEKYRAGEENEPRSVRSGAFQDMRYIPKKIPEGGPLPTVEVPRAVTQACDPCRELADRRNDIVAEIVPVAAQVNRAADAYNTTLAAKEQVAGEARAKALKNGASPEQAEIAAQDAITYAQELPPQKQAYVAARAEYDALQARLDDAHAAYMACEEEMCRKAVAETAGPAFELALGAGYQSLRLPDLAFLGRETPGATAPTLGLVPVARSINDAVYEFGLTAPLGRVHLWEDEPVDLFGDFAVRHFEGDSHEEFGRIDLSGDRLVIPGLGVGSNGNGFVLAYFGGLNSPTDIVADRDYEETSIRASFFFGNEEERSRLVHGLRFGYSAYDTGASFEAAVPGFVRDIAYVQSIEGNEFSIGIFSGIETDIGDGIALGARVGADLVFADYDGVNRLSFTGFADQVVEDDGSEVGWDADFTAYLETQVADNVSITLAAELFYVGGTTAVWQTPGGGEVSRLKAEDRVGFSAGFLMELWW